METTRLATFSNAAAFCATTFVLVILLLSAPTYAQDGSDAIPTRQDDWEQVNASNARRYIERLEKEVTTGKAPAAFVLGRIYELGRGVKADGETAAKWYAKAAELGDSFASLSLASMYAAGDQLPLDYDAADLALSRYAALGGTVPCVPVKSESLNSSLGAVASLCGVLHHWRSYAVPPTRDPASFNKVTHIRLGLNLAKKSLVLIESNASYGAIERAQRGLMLTLGKFPLPKALVTLDEELVFELRYRVTPLEGRSWKWQPLHWTVSK